MNKKYLITNQNTDRHGKTLSVISSQTRCEIGKNEFKSFIALQEKVTSSKYTV